MPICLLFFCWALRATPQRAAAALEEFTVVSAEASAYVTKQNGNTNRLTVTVVETYSNGVGGVDVFTETSAAQFEIKNNASGTYIVAGYAVYVDTKGNDQIRECYIVSSPDGEGGFFGDDGEESDNIAVYYNDAAFYVGNAYNLAVATLWLEMDDGTPQFDGLNGFAVLDTALDDGVWRVTLGYLIAGGYGFTSADKAAILSIDGASDIKLVAARFSGYDENGNVVDFDYYIGIDTGGGDPGDPARYDLNGDGVIDQLDLAVALRYYMVAHGDANWNAARAADFNRDGIVDIEDYIMMLNHMTW